MNLKPPVNGNYAATIVTVNTLIKLDNCDNVQHANIFGNKVIVGKDVTIGTKGIFFPVETQLSEGYLYANNLYRDNTKNKNIDVKGYFEESGRIKCMKFRGNKSEGLFMPIESLAFAGTLLELATLSENDTFDVVNNVEICRKYVPKSLNTPGNVRTQKSLTPKKTTRLVPNQFRFHGDTAMLGKNMHRIKPDTVLSISNKLHGTSFVVGKVLVQRKPKWWEKLLAKLGILITFLKYDLIYSSRKVIKNDDLNKDYSHYYGEDLWADIAQHLSINMPHGMTIYGEAVGYTKSGAMIQPGYDYGCETGQMKVYIYRITLTNDEGYVHEFSAKQVQNWCKERGLNPVPEFFYGKASELLPTVKTDGFHLVQMPDEEWQGELLAKLLDSFNMEKDCELCINKVPAEGIILRIENGGDVDAYKLKAFRFRQRETEMLDKGEVDMETEQSQ
jgi:hypothetical protein